MKYSDDIPNINIDKITSNSFELIHQIDKSIIETILTGNPSENPEVILE